MADYTKMINVCNIIIYNAVRNVTKCQKQTKLRVLLQVSVAGRMTRFAGSLTTIDYLHPGGVIELQTATIKQRR